MSDDWRLRVELKEHSIANQLGELLQAGEIEHELDSAFHDRVVVSVDDNELFCYTGTQAQADAAEQVIRRLATQHEWAADIELMRWHPVAEEWQPPDQALPSSPEEEEREREERVADERTESAEQGYPEYEVRVNCNSHRRARALSETLEQEGIPNLHRSHYVLVGATDEDSAAALATRLRDEVPDATAVTVEFNQREMWDNRRPNPFAWLGGLAGGA